MIDVAYCLFNAFGISTKPDKLMIPKRVNVSKEISNEILSTVTEAKDKGLKINANGREITLDNAESLLKDVGREKIDKREFKKKYINIVDDVEKVLDKSMFTRSQNKMVKILSQLKELVEWSPYIQPDTTNMPESAAQRRNQQGKGLKILTPNQMLSRLPISLAQLKAGNNSEKLKNEIRQLLYSLYRSKKLTKQIYKSLIEII